MNRNGCFPLLWVALVFCVTRLAFASQPVPAIVGSWKTEDSSAVVEISACGDAYCGRIVWLREPTDPKGIPWKDTENPDKPLRTRGILGLTILSGLVADQASTWTNGSIYDPNTGSTYRCRATLKDPSRLILRGYVLTPLFGKSETWKKIKP
jgi:uncharacterized protein (DUF2147 family)